MVIIIFFILHWYLSLFCQSFFQHRYAAHGAFTMSRGWQKVFYVFTYFMQGSSYLSTRAYAVMHRMHHAFADTKEDPHSPKFFSSVFTMMWGTKNTYLHIVANPDEAEAKFRKNVPDWPVFDAIGESRWSRVAWIAVYVVIYYFFATHWWLWLLLPIQIVMGPFHGAIINWFAHKYGYRNFRVNNTSTNLLPVDVLMLGESYHNNHHKFPSSINFGFKWWELDPLYPVTLLLGKLGVIKLNPGGVKRTATEF